MKLRMLLIFILCGALVQATNGFHLTGSRGALRANAQTLRSVEKPNGLTNGVIALDETTHRARTFAVARYRPDAS
jgi:hypothetical protein